MTICIDADGVLTDMTGFNLQYGEKFWRRKPVNPDAYKTGDIFGVSHRQEILFGTRYFYDYCVRLLPRENAAAVNERLNGSGHRLYILTARKYAIYNNPLGWFSKSVFLRWLRKNELHFEDVFFCSEKNTPQEKLSYCTRLSADIMIDDNPDVALHIAESGTQVLLFDAPYNKDIRHENIIRVKSWDDINAKII